MLDTPNPLADFPDGTPYIGLDGFNLDLLVNRLLGDDVPKGFLRRLAFPLTWKG
jgi:hypothetical protein